MTNDNDNNTEIEYPEDMWDGHIEELERIQEFVTMRLPSTSSSP